MKKIICIEGADGSGKSSLAKTIIEETTKRGLSSRVIGRRGADGGPFIGRITSLCQDLAENGTASITKADFHLRLGREYLRANECLSAKADVVILDRFVLSVLSRIRVDGNDARCFIPHLRDIVSVSGLTATIYCNCAFNTAWTRVGKDVESGKRVGLTPKERRGRPYLKKLHEAMSDDFSKLKWLPSRHRIDTDKGFGKMKEQVLALFDNGVFG